MARAIWKGAISFGLVHIPVALQSATSAEGIDFDWLDDRSMDPVGYKRVNKVTGKEVAKEYIVKGVQYETGRYVILSEEEIRTAHPESTQTIDIFSFVDSEQIPLTSIDTPYYLAPDKRGEKVYALLRDTLIETNKVALAYVILHTRQHLAAVMTIDSALVLVLLRWPNEVRTLESIELSDAVTNAKLSKSEKDMAKRLVSDMTGKWEPKEYRDTFQEKIMQLVEKKANKGEVENVETDPGHEERKSADIIDLTELLKRSLRGKNATQPKGELSSKNTKPLSQNIKPPSKSSASAKTASKKSSVVKPNAKSSATKTTHAKSSVTKPKRKSSAR